METALQQASEDPLYAITPFQLEMISAVNQFIDMKITREMISAMNAFIDLQIAENKDLTKAHGREICKDFEA